jgi:hypothetical protein
MRCSDYARTLGEPLAGTAASASTWIALEQPGPWGPKALTDSHLDRALGVALTERSADVAVTVVLMRRIGHHADDHPVERPRNAWVAHVGPGVPWIEHAVLDDPKSLLDLDFSALARGERPGLGAGLGAGVGVGVEEPLLLVCTNSRRDQCCALLGRPVAAELAIEFPGQVWESSHLGGHRLAPTLLSLPDGFMYGGASAASRTLAACRGRTSLSRPAQAAELAALAHLGALHPYPLTVHPADDAGAWLVGDPATGGGAPLLVQVDEVPLDPQRPESCGKPPVPSVTYPAHIGGDRLHVDAGAV